MSQYKVFENIEKIYKGCRLEHFSMAVCHLMDRGFKTVLEMSDEKIDAIKYEPNTKEGCIDLMSEDFIKWLWKTAKDIAIAADEQPANLIMFCQAVDLFDTYHFNGGLNKHRMEEMLNNRLSQENFILSKKKDVETLCELYECEAEEFEALGHEIPEEAFI